MDDPLYSIQNATTAFMSHTDCISGTKLDTEAIVSLLLVMLSQACLTPVRLKISLQLLEKAPRIVCTKRFGVIKSLSPSLYMY